MLKRTVNIPIGLEPVVIPDEPVVNPPAELNKKITLRRLQQYVKRPTILDDYVYLPESDFSIDKFRNSFNEAMSCLDSDYWLTDPNPCTVMMCGMYNIEGFKTKLIAKGFTQRE